MSDEVTITSGGAISVDSGAIRDLGRRLGAVAVQVRDAAHTVRRAQHALLQIGDRPGYLPVGQTGDSAYRLESAAALASEYAGKLPPMADTFELVELRARQAALSAQDSAAAFRLQDRIDELAAVPGMSERIAGLESSWREHRFDGVTDQPWDDMIAWAPVAFAGVTSIFAAGLIRQVYHPIGTIMGSALAEVEKSGGGVLEPGAALRGDTPAVEVAVVASGAVAPVSGLRDSMERVPYEHKGQVAVEKYTMADGSTRFVTYIDGTRTGGGADDPWDISSDLDMYLRHETTASHQAVLDALEAAGAEPGDSVDIVGYSQGAMIGSFMAIDSPYNVQTVIAAGDPVEPALGPAQTIVNLENQADPIRALALGGEIGGTGSSDSFTVQRVTDERSSPFDPHMHPEYVRTAELADASNDARVQHLKDTFFAGLGEAVSVERTEFSAKRP